MRAPACCTPRFGGAHDSGCYNFDADAEPEPDDREPVPEPVKEDPAEDAVVQW